ncbi:uncharacterized protein LOC121726072 [Aricia agestis]|uniref:uncharacterized protein LOC121726072 n=1 Tax=Aricia agestis TaxID=91739 RepID=UPI001C205825|nr:uncharacterized protein LOC121726072 [Aricia agestis]
MALRMIRGYRTVATEAAFALAGTPPWDLEARVHAEIYSRTAAAKERGERVPPDWRRQARMLIMRTWQDQMASPTAGHRVVAAIRPVLEDWVAQRNGTLSYRMVQMLTGHGCFGHYLHHTARREPTPQCHHCTEEDDTAQHTLVACPAWVAQRAELCAAIGPDLTLPDTPGHNKSTSPVERSLAGGLCFLRVHHDAEGGR